LRRCCGPGDEAAEIALPPSRAFFFGLSAQVAKKFVQPFVAGGDTPLHSRLEHHFPNLARCVNRGGGQPSLAHWFDQNGSDYGFARLAIHAFTIDDPFRRKDLAYHAMHAKLAAILMAQT